ncbi:hypothetical protein FD754_012376 [Muntiacus muntjak]|uniref:Uncharacterized protein n=1 Tax=Muntiacus muntjak TaxID=9888 RepID=A0A5N3VE19_MUNMU|nr:hypothetical protein FD754_012376 [Muntiacus muntjak]
MNDDNSDGKTEDELQSLFICDKNGNTYAYNQKSPPTQNTSTNNVSWHLANPDGMLVDYETDSDVDIGEKISLTPQCVEVHDHQTSSSNLISQEALEVHMDSTCPSCAHVVNTAEPKHLHSSCHSLGSLNQSVETSLTFVWKTNNDDLNCTDNPTALLLNQTFDIKVDNVNCTFVTHDTTGKSQPLPTTASLQSTNTRSINTSLSCSILPSPHSDKIHVRETSCDRESFENSQAVASQAQDTAYTVFSDMVMQVDVVVPDTENQCHRSSEKVASEYPDGTRQRRGREKGIQALTQVSDGMDVPSGSVLQEFFCSSKDEPNRETHSQSSYGQKEMGQNVRETVSNCLIDDECLLLVPAVSKSKTQVLGPKHQVTVTKDTPTASNEKHLETQNRTVELIPNSPPGQKEASLLELTWNADDMVISTNNRICMSTPILEPMNTTFSISPVEGVEKCSKVQTSNRELQCLPNLKAAPMIVPKLNLGKSTTKANSPLGSKVRKTKIISYPRPNFKNVKAKVVSRPVLQPKDPALSKAAPRSQLTGASSPSSVSSSRQSMGLSKTATYDLNADPKAEIPINKTHKQQFNKLITSQAVHVTTHSKNASHKKHPRTTSAMKSNQEDVDKASSSNPACETGSVAAVFQIKDELPVKMESTERLEVPYSSNIDRISPEKKGEEENGTSVAKQELKKEILNETSDFGSLFLDSTSKPAGVSGGKPATPSSSVLRKTPGLKAKVGPSVSCLRRNSDSRNLTSDRAVSPQRIRRVSSSGITELNCMNLWKLVIISLNTFPERTENLSILKCPFTEFMSFCITEVLLEWKSMLSIYSTIQLDLILGSFRNHTLSSIKPGLQQQITRQRQKGDNSGCNWETSSVFQSGCTLIHDAVLVLLYGKVTQLHIYPLLICLLCAVWKGSLNLRLNIKSYGSQIAFFFLKQQTVVEIKTEQLHIFSFSFHSNYSSLLSSKIINKSKHMHISQVVKKSACNAEHPSSIPGSGRSPGEGIAVHSSIHGVSWWFSW